MRSKRKSKRGPPHERRQSCQHTRETPPNTTSVYTASTHTYSADQEQEQERASSDLPSSFQRATLAHDSPHAADDGLHRMA
jgi:hypothetical protein